jgi:ABC-type multidrug transport system fused ATPase/permease subunit
MELDVNDRVVAKPTAADIEGALDASSFPDNWFITLDDGDASLDAIADGSSFVVTYANGAMRRKAHADAAAVKTAFVKYLHGDREWQSALRWDTAAHAAPKPTFVKDTRPLIGRGGDGPPQWAIVVMVVVIGFVVLMFGSPWIAYSLFPFAHSDAFWIGLIALPMITLILLAVASKGLDLRRAASWETTTGRIVSSKIAQRTIKFAGEPERIENYAAIIYEFTANGRKVQGSRIGIGDDTRDADAAPTVKRYPVGANVTVYYDANDPKNCVLERGGPKGIEAKGCVMAVVELAVAGAILWALIARGPALVKARFPNANEDVVVIAFGIGVLLCMMAYAQWRMSKAAAAWPSVPGTIVRSEVESYEERVGGANGTLTTFYRPVIEYAYAVGGEEYRAAQIRLNVALSGAKSLAESVTGKYPQGGSVSVRYDPDNPSNAALENPGSVSWYLLTMAAAAFVFAAWQTAAFG